MGFSFFSISILFFVLLSGTNATHFRGGTISYTRAPGSLTVSFEIISHWYVAGIYPRTQDYQISFGDGSTYAPSAEGGFDVEEIDGSGTIRTIVYSVDHTYASANEYVAFFGGCCRQSAVINGGDASYRVEAGVNLLTDLCLGNPRVTVPGKQDVMISEDASFGISPATPTQSALSYEFTGNSLLDVNPPVSALMNSASLVARVPSLNGVDVVWNTLGGTTGQIYGISVKGALIAVPSCYAVWDITLELTSNAPPTCTDGSGSFTAATTDSLSIPYAAFDAEGDAVTAGVIGDLPPGAVLSENNVLTWDAPLTAGSYGWSIQFCDPSGLCGACSTSLSVSNELPQVEITVNATLVPGESGELGSEFTFVIEAANISPQGASDPVTVGSIDSSLHGDLVLYGCPVGTVITPESPYQCNYTAAVTSYAPNLITIQGTDDEASQAADTAPVYAFQAPSTAPDGNTSTVALSCSAPGTPLCVTDADCGIDGTQQGFCDVNSGTCQCGGGFGGNGTLVDPTQCFMGCTPPAIPDSVVFLNESITNMAAESAHLVVTVEHPSWLKQKPTTIALLNPTTGQRCGVLPDLLGTCQVEQILLVDQCALRYRWVTPFAPMVFQSGCFHENPQVVDVQPMFEVTKRSFSTILEVVQRSKAPFGQQASQKRQQLETEISRLQRQQFTFEIDTRFIMRSPTFQVLANGNIRYRLVRISYEEDYFEVVTETRVTSGGRVFSANVDLAQSVNVSALVRDAVSTGCTTVGSECQQFHSVRYDKNPCRVDAAEQVLEVELLCDDGATPDTCGFINLPQGNIFTLRNLFLQYDSCERVVEIGIDTSESSLRLYQDAQRSVVLDPSIDQGQVAHGRLVAQPSDNAGFLSATLQSLKVIRVASPAAVDLGDQLDTAFLTLLSQRTLSTAVDQAALWDFELELVPDFFQLTEVYYLEADVNLTFSNTGGLTRSRQVVVRSSLDTGLSSPTFTLKAAPEAPPPSVEIGTVDFLVIDLIGVAIALISLVALVLAYVYCSRAMAAMGKKKEQPQVSDQAEIEVIEI